MLFNLEQKVEKISCDIDYLGWQILYLAHDVLAF